MPDKPTMNDPQSVWQNQPTEAFKMSVNQLLLKMQQREKKARFEATYSIIIGLVLFVFFALGCARIPELVPRLGFGVISIWSLYFGYEQYQRLRRIWRGRLTPDATADTTIRSYRASLEKRNEFGRRVWFMLIPPFLGTALFVVPALIRSVYAPRLLLDLIPFFVLLAIWFVMLAAMKRHRQRKLQQEIEQLDAFEREYQSSHKRPEM